jgi:hypothetical protein
MRRLEISESELTRLHSLDVPNHEIAKILGCCKSVVERRLKALGLKKARTGPKAGEKHPDWAGGKTIRKGYIYVYAPWHPHCINGRYVAEHRLVMEQILGRQLLRSEVVHHIDGNRQNNDPTNLLLYPTNGQYLYEHLKGSPEHGLRIQEGLRKRLEREHSLYQLTQDGQQDTQTTDHPSS